MAPPERQPLPEGFEDALSPAFARDPGLVGELREICAGLDQAATVIFLEELVTWIDLVPRPAAAVLPALDALARRNRSYSR